VEVILVQLSLDNEDRRQRRVLAAQASLKRLSELIKELRRQLANFDIRVADGRERSPYASEERAALVERVNFLIVQVDELCNEQDLPIPAWRRGVTVE
jgi:hypothetical protein